MDTLRKGSQSAQVSQFQQLLEQRGLGVSARGTFNPRNWPGLRASTKQISAGSKVRGPSHEH